MYKLGQDPDPDLDRLLKWNVGPDPNDGDPEHCLTCLLLGGGRAGESCEGSPDLQHSQGGLQG